MMMQQGFDFPLVPPDNLIARHFHLTRTVMPRLALEEKPHWPVQSDHCCLRIVLDIIRNGLWTEHIARPARPHLGQAQALAAVRMCEAITADDVDLTDLNQ